MVQQMSNFEIINELRQCIQKVDEYSLSNINVDFNIQQIIQLYKGLSLCELSKYVEGIKHINQLVEMSQQKKGERVEEIDLLIQTLYQQQIKDYDFDLAVTNNKNLLDFTLKYQKQNEGTAHYDKGIYYFALGMYKYIETKGNNEYTECIDLLKQSYDNVKSYKQEIGVFLAINLYYQGKYEEIITNEYAEINTNYPGFANILAFCYERLDNNKEAENCYLHAEKLCPENTILLGNIAQFYKDQDEKELEYLEKAYNVDPNSGHTCQSYGFFLYENNQKEKGLQILNQGMKTSPNYLDLFETVAQIELSNENFDKSLQILQDFVENNPNNSRGFQIIANLLCNNQQYNEAIPYYIKFLNCDKRINPQTQDSRYNMAECFFYCNLHEESLKEFIELQNSTQKSINDDIEIESINSILNHSLIIPHERKLQIISDINGLILLKLDPLIELDNSPSILIALKQKQEFFRQLLSIKQYQKIIQPNLSFQSNVSHWDLYID